MSRTIVVLCAALMTLAACRHPLYHNNPASYVPPEQVVYERVPGFGVSGTDLLEWAQKSGPGSGEPAVPATLDAPKGLRLRWLGTAGFEISDDDTAILVDPFVSRPEVNPLLSDKAQFRLEIDTAAVDRYVIDPMKRSGAFDKLKVILVSHTHHDHVEDVPYILSRVQKASSRPLVAGDKNLVGVLKAYRNREKEMPWLKGIESLRSGPQKIFDFNEKKMLNPLPTQRLGLPVGTFGKFTITAYISQHGLYDALPFNLEGDVSGKAPLTGLQYKAYLNSSMTYLIEYNTGSDLPGGPNRTLRIFASDSARFLNNERVSAEVAEGGPVDILLEGIASRIKDNKIPQRIDGFKPTYFIPTHYDNFFKPMDQFQIFDFMIMDPIIAPNDNSRLSEFIRTFGQDIHVPPPKLRMMKMFYYYSLQNLLTNPR